ncbi:glycosyltransferase [Acidithiobacillus thiooxidans]|uniref:glycosyltransferase n=1 Tax=Acidithiobacillus thiooxidans TaxID=930 RepID=UPI00242B07FE|nr:glycosyltransferase [Acidithiobacillus thiooxidans]
MSIKIIFCALVNPYRKHANGGSEDIRRRIAALASTVGSVTVYAIDYPEELVTPESLPANVHLHLYERGIDPRFWRWHYPLPCIRRHSRRMVVDIRRAITDSADQFVIFIEGMQLFSLWSDIKSVMPKDAKAILRVHNIESAYHHSVAAESRGLLKLAHQMSSLQYRPLENRFLSDFTYLYAISEKEAEALVSQYGLAADKVRLVLPIPTDKPCGDKGKNGDMPFVLSYFGDLTLPNNYVGLRWFCDNVLPRLDGDRVELQVAGKGSEQFSVYDRVRVCGFVDDIDAFVCQSQIVVAPIFSGAGIKIKVLDAVGYGKPIITTPKGVEGFPAWLANQLYIASSADEFVQLLTTMILSYDDAANKAETLKKEVSARMGQTQFQRQLLKDIK